MTYCSVLSTMYHVSHHCSCSRSDVPYRCAALAMTDSPRIENFAPTGPHILAGNLHRMLRITLRHILTDAADLCKSNFRASQVDLKDQLCSNTVEILLRLRTSDPISFQSMLNRANTGTSSKAPHASHLRYDLYIWAPIVTSAVWAATLTALLIWWAVDGRQIYKPGSAWIPL